MKEKPINKKAPTSKEETHFICFCLLGTFQCSIRKTGQYPKPVLTRGWVAFVKSKNLQVGDKVRFIKRKNRATAAISYKVRAEKAIKISGAPFGRARI
ncbi:LOW QUALITY PROTEIN: hypothetical protein NC653_034301 [Populus alba x Populus x berolinensis]|uniref:TF-B3 domain-containing protein n=1 Tax=Populus alba x Populus x berolinensis TaxID=444605 RepID=A0AAD6LMI1_9ROSI|nr:LOW QUALITY PROTEIN: hypothetical protein NC653_034301 [Populus alba x Populus x berolinensis]